MKKRIKKVRLFHLTGRLSSIHGKGLFTLVDILPFRVIYETTKYKVTPHPIYGSLQRTPREHLLEKWLKWENHSCVSNTEIVFDGDKVLLISLSYIRAGSELVCDYRDTEDRIPIPFKCNCGQCPGRTIA